MLVGATFNGYGGLLCSPLRWSQITLSPFPLLEQGLTDKFPKQSFRLLNNPMGIFPKIEIPSFWRELLLIKEWSLQRAYSGKRHTHGKKWRNPCNFPKELFTLMVVFGRSVAGVSGYSSGRRGLRMQPSFLKSTTQIFGKVCMIWVGNHLCPSSCWVDAQEYEEDTPISYGRFFLTDYSLFCMFNPSQNKFLYSWRCQLWKS